jgi:DNA repair protein RecO (recombination protein O)
LERDEPLPELFDTYACTLADLHRAAEESASLRLFERELLNELGVGLVLTHDSDGQPLTKTGWYRYLSGSGPTRVAGSESQPPGCVSGASLLAFANDWLTEASVLRDAQALTREALAEQLGGRPLRSRELLPLRQSTSASRAIGAGKRQ